jgi:sugar lactone lactonase YvrE
MGRIHWDIPTGLKIVITNRHSAIYQWIAILFICTLAACGSVPKTSDIAKDASEAVFYPPSPGEPRIQLLATFTGEKDFAGKRSDFAQFVAGEETSRTLVTIYGVGMFEGKIFAVDSKAAAIATFDLNKQQYSIFNGTGGGKMKLPINITVDTDGTKYVTDTGRNQVLLYDRENRFLGAYGSAEQFRPVDTATVGDKLYVVDILHHEVQVLNKRSGNLLFKFGKSGGNLGELLHPTNIAVGPNGDIFVVETSNFRVQRFTPDGLPVRLYGEVGDTSGKFARPKGIAIDKQGRMHVADAAFQNVQTFDTNDGKLLMAYGQPEKGEGLSLPAAVKIDYDNVALFKRYAAPNFNVEYLILVTSQVAPNKIDVFGFGQMAGAGKSQENAPK